MYLLHQSGYVLWRCLLQNTVPEIEDERALAACIKDAVDLGRRPLSSSDKHLRIEVPLDAPPKATLDRL